MSNMSYCRFENTLVDLRDCVNALGEDGIPIGEYEKVACEKMRELCKRYIEMYDERDEENDNDI